MMDDERVTFRELMPFLWERRIDALRELLKDVSWIAGSFLCLLTAIVFFPEWDNLCGALIATVWAARIGGAIYDLRVAQDSLRATRAELREAQETLNKLKEIRRQLDLMWRGRLL